MKMTHEQLAAIVTAHGKWLRGEDGGAKADLRRADLRGADLRWAYLRGADLSYANLSFADLRVANLRVANLRWADLSGADLRGANLSGADLDYSSGIPLHCGGSHCKVDARQMRQFAAHLCTLDCDYPEWQALRAALLPFARQSHRAGDLGLLEAAQ